MAIADHKTLRSRATDKEALVERASKLTTVPSEVPQRVFENMSARCRDDLADNPTTPPALYRLVVDKYVLQRPISHVPIGERLRILECLGIPNGIKLVFVRIDSAGRATLAVHFHNRNYLGTILHKLNSERVPARRIFSISGGHRLPAGPASGMVQVTDIGGDVTQPVLNLTVQPVGDYSTYKLRLNTSEFDSTGPIVIDPLFNEIDFKFRPGCFNINCNPDWKSAPEPADEPVIDYLAKDYDSFRHTMIAAMMQRVPNWQPSSEADLDQVLLELFSAAADELSDYQDRVMNEAYLSSARKRVSLARHARLMDYHIHQGNQASTWLALEVDLATDSAPQGGETRQYFLSESFRAWSGAAKLDGSSVVFHAGARERVHQLANRMSLYTWSGAIPSLLAGDTSADLKLFSNAGTSLTDQPSAVAVQDLIRGGVIKRLLIQEYLNPATATVNGVNPRKRQLLELLPGNDGAEAMLDPATGEWFVRVRWAEKNKLTSNYCFTIDGPSRKVEDASLFHGNLVEVNHGRRERTFFKEPGEQLNTSREFHYERTENWGAICVLPEHPLAYRMTEPGGDVWPRSTLSVEVAQPGGGRDFWDEVPSLVHSDQSDESGDHFIVETDEDGFSVIRFGNGTNGKSLPARSVVECTYQIGAGLEGNIGLDKLINFNPGNDAFLKLEGNVVAPSANGSSIIRCWNPFDVNSGRAPEPTAEIIRRVPEAYRERQLRAVTLNDYVKRAEELPEVARAAAAYAWTGSWRTVRITIDPAGATTLDEATRQRIARHLNAVRLIGEDIEIRLPQFVPLEIHIALCANLDFWPRDLKAILEQEFSDGWTPDGRKGFFHPDLWTFGQSLRSSQIFGRVLAVEGVEHVISLTMKRWNVPVVSSDITVNSNEIIQVFNDPDQMEKGLITFDVRGGRR